MVMFVDKIYGKWMAETQKEKMEKILETVGIQNLEGKKILDVGSGPGFLSGMLDESAVGCSVISSDIDLENIKKINDPKVLASGDFLPFSKAFDFIFCIDTVHLLDKERIAGEFAGVLKYNGILIVSAFCSRYNSEERMRGLERLLSGFRIEKKFFAQAEKEWDAVIVARLK